MPAIESEGGETTGYESDLWALAGTLPGVREAAEYKHILVRRISFTYISDAFERHHATVCAEWGAQGAKYRYEDIPENIFWVAREARWARFKTGAWQPTVGQTADCAIAGIKQDDGALTEVLPKDYARPVRDRHCLGQLIALIGNIRVGDFEFCSRNTFGRVYEFCLSRFASAEAKRGGDFHTAGCVLRLLVQMLEPHGGRAYDPFCDSSGMFGQSVDFIRGNGNDGNTRGVVSIHGRESYYGTWRLEKMHLAICDIGGQGTEGDGSQNDRHPGSVADSILGLPAV